MIVAPLAASRSRLARRTARLILPGTRTLDEARFSKARTSNVTEGSTSDHQMARVTLTAATAAGSTAPSTS